MYYYAVAAQSLNYLALMQSAPTFIREFCRRPRSTSVDYAELILPCPAFGTWQSQLVIWREAPNEPSIGAKRQMSLRLARSAKFAQSADEVKRSLNYFEGCGGFSTKSSSISLGVIGAEFSMLCGAAVGGERSDPFDFCIRL